MNYEKIEHVCKVTNRDKETVKVTVSIDFSNVEREDLMAWALSNRIISGQKIWRDLSKKEIEEYVDKHTFHAYDVGRKIETPEERLRNARRVVANLSPREAAELLKSVNEERVGKEEDEE